MTNYAYMYPSNFIKINQYYIILYPQIFYDLLRFYIIYYVQDVPRLKKVYYIHINHYKFLFFLFSISFWHMIRMPDQTPDQTPDLWHLTFSHLPKGLWKHKTRENRIWQQIPIDSTVN
jgi:hypothetical protein